MPWSLRNDRVVVLHGAMASDDADGDDGDDSAAGAKTPSWPQGLL